MTLKKIISFLIPFGLISCTTLDLVSIESNRAQDYPAINTKFIIIAENDKDVQVIDSDSNSIDSSLNHILGEGLKNCIESQGIETIFIEPSPLSLDPNETSEKIQAYGSRYYLEFKRTGQSINVKTTPGYMSTVGTPGQPGYRSTYISGSASTELKYSYDLLIRDINSNRIVWRSYATVIGPVRMDTVEELIHDVLIQMVDDKILEIDKYKLPIYKPKKVLTQGGTSLLIIGVIIPLAYFATF